jgi:ACR3 family arsenite transporter
VKSKTLSLLDRLLTLWIFLAMAIGVTLSVYTPAVNQWISHFTFSGTSLPIVIGLLVMMYPPLAKVEFKGFISSFGETKK